MVATVATRCDRCGVSRMDLHKDGSLHKQGPCICTLGPEEWERRQSAQAKVESARLEQLRADRRRQNNAKDARDCWEMSERLCRRLRDDLFEFCSACPRWKDRNHVAKARN